MPQRRTAIKERRKNIARHSHNLSIKNALKKSIKKFLSLIENKSLPEAEAQLKLLNKKIDKSVKRHQLQKNTAAHRKSRFSKLLASIKS